MLLILGLPVCECDSVLHNTKYTFSSCLKLAGNLQIFGFEFGCMHIYLVFIGLFCLVFHFHIITEMTYYVSDRMLHLTYLSPFFV